MKPAKGEASLLAEARSSQSHNVLDGLVTSGIATSFVFVHRTSSSAHYHLKQFRPSLYSFILLLALRS